MPSEYRERLSGEPNGLPEIELRLSTTEPAGVLDTYHIAVDCYVEWLRFIQDSTSDPVLAEQIKRGFHQIIASTAILGYTAGTMDSAK